MAYSPDSIIAVGIVLPTLALIAVCLRFYVRLRLAKTYIGLDDYLIAVAVVLCLADGANLAYAAIDGILGRNYEGELPVERNRRQTISDYAKIIAEKLLYGLMKLSVLFFFRRIFVVQKSFRVFNNVMIAIVSVWTLAFFLSEVFLCGPHPEKRWLGKDRTHCVDENNLNLVYAVTDATFDILIIVMPFPCIRKLKMDRRQQLGVAGIFALGALSTLAAILRLGFISYAYKRDYSSAGNKHAAGTPPAVWSSVEAGVGVLAACLPPCGPLIRSTRDVGSTIARRYHNLVSSGSQGRKESHEGLDKSQEKRESEGRHSSTSSESASARNAEWEVYNHERDLPPV